jgi:AAA domain
MYDIIGKAHNDLLKWLVEDWWINGPAVCVLQGFPGVGKTRLAEVLVERIQKERNIPLAVQIECPESHLGLVDDLYLELAQALDVKGESEFANDLSDHGLLSLLQRPILIVVDEFQRSFFERPGSPANQMASRLSQVARLGPVPGRLLLLTSREVDATERWAERCKIISLSGLKLEDGAEFLTRALLEKGMSEAIPEHRRNYIVQWLGVTRVR